MSKLDVGQPAPSFSAETTDGRTMTEADFKGQWTVLYFYPKAFTSGCTVQTERFNDNFDDVAAYGGTVVGVSTDDVETQCAFADKHGGRFPLLADADGSVAKAFGVMRGLLGVAKRVTFVIDPDGKVAGRFHHELRIGRHLDDVLALLKAKAQPPSEGAAA